MIDEVGLVTPTVTDLKRRQIGPEQYASIFKPDYIIVHCDDLTRVPDGPGLSYTLAKTFNPLDFYPGMDDPQHVAWVACYRIWKRNTQ